MRLRSVLLVLCLALAGIAPSAARTPGHPGAAHGHGSPSSGAGVATAAGLADEELDLPNLVPLPAHTLGIGLADDRSGPALRFAVTTVNMGAHSFDVLPEQLDPFTARAHQCVRWAAPRVCLERREVGRMHWHDDHQHFHLQDYAQFELRRLDEEGQPVLGAEGLVAVSRKLGFCLAEFQQHHDAGPPYVAPYYVFCAATIGYQGLSPGWQDTYAATRTGQQIPLAGIPDGEYALLVRIDPDEGLYESDRSDNVSVRFLELRDGRVFWGW
jgi:hypothetical protein